MKNRKGQGALEYLMTYGWAILIIVIIGGALYALGVFNPSTWTSSKRATGFASLQVKDWKVAGTGTSGVLTLVVGNKYGSSITVDAFEGNRTGSPGLACNNGVGTTLAENQEMTMTSDTNITCRTGLSTGKSYSLDVQIHFTANGVSHIDSGTITGKVE